MENKRKNITDLVKHNIKSEVMAMHDSGELKISALEYRPEAAFKDEYCGIAFEELSEGKTLYTLCFRFGVTPSTLLKWKDEYPQFRNAVEEGIMIASAWWEEVGRRNIDNNKFNTNLYMHQMQNRFGWTRDSKRGNLGGDGVNYVDNRKMEVYIEGEEVSKDMVSDDREQLSPAEKRAKIAEMLSKLSKAPEIIESELEK